MHKSDIVKKALQAGFGIDYGRFLSVCNLSNYSGTSGVKFRRRYQVHFEKGNDTISEIYNDIDEAVEKFMKLSKKTK